MINTWDGTGIYCSDCGIEKLSEIRPREGMYVRDRRHGQHHSADVEPLELLRRLAGTLEGSAIVECVQGVVGPK